MLCSTIQMTAKKEKHSEFIIEIKGNEKGHGLKIWQKDIGSLSS